MRLLTSPIRSTMARCSGVIAQPFTLERLNHRHQRCA
jgi:hypothetical protein